MDYIGTYKVELIQTPVVEGEKMDIIWADKEKYLSLGDQSDAHEMQERAMIFDCLMEVNEDGMCYNMMTIPDGVSQEEIDEAIAGGAKLVDEKHIIVDEGTPWEMRGDDFYTKSGTGGELLGEKVDPWIKSNEDDGSIIMGDFVRIKYTKI